MGVATIIQSAIEYLEKGDELSAITTLKDLLKSITNGTEYRVKLGTNPYSNEWKCSIKGCSNDGSGGLYFLIERMTDGKDITIVICPECLKKGELYEKKLTFGEGVIKDVGLA